MQLVVEVLLSSLHSKFCRCDSWTHLLLSGDEVLQVERFKVCHVGELTCHMGFLCQWTHVFGQRFDATYEMGIGVSDDLFAFVRAVSKEINGMLVGQSRASSGSSSRPSNNGTHISSSVGMAMSFSLRP